MPDKPNQAKIPRLQTGNFLLADSNTPSPKSNMEAPLQVAQIREFNVDEPYLRPTKNIDGIIMYIMTTNCCKLTIDAALRR